MPEFIPPSLATLSDKAPSAANWVHEIKFDGYRIQAHLRDGAVTLKTRTGLDWTTRWPTVTRALKGFADAAILDGEIVSANAHGVSDFSALQDDLKNDRHDRMVFYLFDLLHRDGFDLTRVPLVERKEQLALLFADRSKDGVVRVSEHFETDGPTLLRHACGMGLEGVLSKVADGPYRSGRHAQWLKTKCTASQEFVVAGYEPSDKTGRAIRSLIVGFREDGAWRYAGRVGTGWGAKVEDELMARLKPLARNAMPFKTLPAEERPKKVRWVEPQVVVEVEFRGWTGSSVLRQASLKGVREDKPAKDVVRERVPAALAEPRQAAARKAAPRKTAKGKASRSKPAGSPARAKAGAGSKAASGRKPAVEVAGVALTNPERVYWEDAGVTKADLARYYEAVWEHMAPHVTGRVLSLVRCPDGASGQCFYQKHASAGVDASRLTLVKEPDGEESIAIDDLAGLVALAQAGVLEVHVRGSTADDLERANRIVFDLDPGPGVEWRAVIDGAREVRERLSSLKLESFVKTTGGKGLHVVVPIKPAPWDEVKDFSRGVAEGMAGDTPKAYTATIKKAARDGKILIDYFRNSREATAVAPYSTRARPGAPVSVPLSWDELGRLKTPNGDNVKTLPAKLKRRNADPWAGIGELKQALP